MLCFKIRPAEMEGAEGTTGLSLPFIPSALWQRRTQSTSRCKNVHLETNASHLYAALVVVSVIGGSVSVW